VRFTVRHLMSLTWSLASSCQIRHQAQVHCSVDAGALVVFNEVLEPLNSMVTKARFTWVSSVFKTNGNHDEWQYTPTRCVCHGVKVSRNAEVQFSPVLWDIPLNHKPEPDDGEGEGRTMNQNWQNWVWHIQFWFELGLNLRTYIAKKSCTTYICIGKLSEKEKMKITQAPQLACCKRGCWLHGVYLVLGDCWLPVVQSLLVTRQWNEKRKKYI